MRIPTCWILLLAISLSNLAAETFFIDYSTRPDHAALVVHDSCVVHSTSNVDLKELHRSGRKVLAYLSVVEVASDAHYRNEIKSKSLRILGTNEAWNSSLMDVASPAWRDFVVDFLAKEVFERDFDGLFLDTADSVELLAKMEPSRSGEFGEGLVSIIKALKLKHPGKTLIMNRGFSVWEKVKGDLDGILIESVFQTWDLKEKRYRPVDPAGSAWLSSIGKKIKEAGLKVWAVDYVDPKDAKLARETVQRLEGLGFAPLITTPNLNGAALAPLRRLPRKVVVIYGNDSNRPEEMLRWPVESYFSKTSQLILEWLGFEVEYIHAANGSLPSDFPEGCAGIVVDRQVLIPPSKEPELVEWMLQMKEMGTKLIFIGEIPFRHKTTRPLMLKALGIQGTLSTMEPQGVTLHALDPGTNFESEARFIPNRFKELRAPEGARRFLTVGASTNATVRFDAVFTADWGGLASDPYVFFRRPDFVELWLVNPFEFFRAALGVSPSIPVPDSTTADGVRLFFTHIDGDGLRHQSAVEPGKTSGEIILERVIEKYPFPHSVSVIEAEVRGLVTDQKPGDEEKLTKLARRILSLPYVEAGSHSYSHPFYWIEGDSTAQFYSNQALKLKEGFEPKGIDLKREIEGSVRYIQEKLLPPDKRVEIMLWSGNTKPPPEAFGLIEALGIQALNGGSTTISKRYPTVTCASPRGIQVGDHYQVFAVNDNDNVYQQGNVVVRSASSTALAGGFIHILDTFEKTETPRRLKPANIYYHFYSGDNHASLRSLLKVFDWASNSELQATTAASYARMAHDTRNTGVFEDQSGGIWFGNRGLMRTIRVDSAEGIPDLDTSKGVIGYRVTPSGTYIHGDGSGIIVFRRGNRSPNHLYLSSSTAPVKFRERKAGRLEFEVTDRREVTLVVGGAAASEHLAVKVNATTTSVVANADGLATLKLPMQSKVVIESK